MRSYSLKENLIGSMISEILRYIQTVIQLPLNKDYLDMSIYRRTDYLSNRVAKLKQ